MTFTIYASIASASFIAGIGYVFGYVSGKRDGLELAMKQVKEMVSLHPKLPENDASGFISGGEKR